ncbi:MAG: matrixin family metalloprotease [Gemmatimonadaceae bacterium]
MPAPSSRLARFVAGTAAFALATIPASSVVRPVPSRTDVASSGAVARELTPKAAELARSKAAVRRQLAERGAGTYIGEMVAERDSSLARWHDRKGVPLKVWIQPGSHIKEWRPDYPTSVRDAFLTWDGLELPVRFAFTADSASADVHVSFIDHFDEPISGRTKWARDDDWWIIDADIVLAVHHSSGRTLDDDAMKAMALHEIGHLLGLDHTEDLTSIMAPRVRVRELSLADRATVRLLYTLPPGGVR